MNVRKLPLYRDLAGMLASEPGREWTHDELASLLEVARDSKDYNILMVKCRKELLKAHNLDLLNIPGVGYRIATASETVNVSMRRQDKRIHRTIIRKHRLMGTVNATQLDQPDRRKYDSHLCRLGLETAFYRQLPQQVRALGHAPKSDVPKLGCS